MTGDEALPFYVGWVEGGGLREWNKGGWRRGKGGGGVLGRESFTGFTGASAVKHLPQKKQERAGRGSERKYMREDICCTYRYVLETDCNKGS